MSKKIINFLLVVLGIAAVLGGWLLTKTEDPQGIMTALPYVLIGIGCGLFGHGVGELINQKVYASHPEQQRQAEIDRQDERNVMIANAAKSRGYTMMVYVFAALMVAFALMPNSMQFVIPLVIAYLFVTGYTAYWHIRLDRKL